MIFGILWKFWLEDMIFKDYWIMTFWEEKSHCFGLVHNNGWIENQGFLNVAGKIQTQNDFHLLNTHIWTWCWVLVLGVFYTSNHFTKKSKLQLPNSLKNKDFQGSLFVPIGWLKKLWLKNTDLIFSPLVIVRFKSCKVCTALC